MSQFSPADYILNITHKNDIDETLSEIRKAEIVLGGKIVGVIAGIEPGVILADLLSEKLHLLSNGTRLSAARRNKYLMADELNKKGISVPDYFKSDNLEQIISWVEKRNIFPVVVKPLDSAGSDGVYICNDISDVTKAFNYNIDRNNILGKKNKFVLVQSFLKGQEYIVNTVSCSGHHFVSDIWVSTKKLLAGHGFIYDREEIISADTAIARQLTAYCFSILDALDIKFGPAHIELMLTDSGPMLIEIGARMGGGVNTKVTDFCVGHNQVELTVDAYVDPDAFFRTINKKNQLLNHGMWVILSSEKSETIIDIPLITQLSGFETIMSVNMRLKAGNQLKITTDLNSSPGNLHLAHKNNEKLQEEYSKIRELAKNGFLVQPASNPKL